MCVCVCLSHFITATTQGDINVKDITTGQSISFEGNSIQEAFPYLGSSYDAIFALAHALANVTNRGLPVTGTNLYEALLHVDFQGITGRVAFNSIGDRISS